MKKIQYYYSAMSKQVFLIILCLFFAARFTIFFQVVKYNISGYADDFNIAGTLILYVIYILFCIFFFFGYKFCFTLYNEEEAIYHNKLLKKQYHVDLNKIDRAVLTKRGICLYYPESRRKCFYIPFWRLGKISPVGVDDFYNLLKSKDIHIEKQFVTLPGFGKSKGITSLIYSCLALFTLGGLTQAVALAVAIFKSH